MLATNTIKEDFANIFKYEKSKMPNLKIIYSI